MGTETKIQWCDHTFNPWWGCTKVSAGCANCYAETFARRTGRAKWGDDEPRVVVSDATWRNPVKWDKAAAKAGVRRRVFCGSMCDVFEDLPELEATRERLWSLIEVTPNLDWLLLTKRPENWRLCWPLVPVLGHVSQNKGDGKTWQKFDNIWLGTSVENQATADKRIPVLLSIPASVRFLSMEPLLGPVDVLPHVGTMRERSISVPTVLGPHITERVVMPPRIAWVIVGGESGSKARPFDLAWARSIRDQCQAAGVAWFMKQVGAKPGGMNHPLGFPETFASWKPTDSHGADPDEWPEDLRVREFPS
jgi:protein gp37